MLAHDRPLVHGRGALGSPHGHTPSFAANTGPREVTSSAAPREHGPAGGREGEVYRPSYAARALVWVRWTRGAPWFGCCSRGAAQLEARRGEHLHYAQPRVLVGPTSRRGRGCILLVIPRAWVYNPPYLPFRARGTVRDSATHLRLAPRAQHVQPLKVPVCKPVHVKHLAVACSDGMGLLGLALALRARADIEVCAVEENAAARQGGSADGMARSWRSRRCSGRSLGVTMEEDG